MPRNSDCGIWGGKSLTPSKLILTFYFSKESSFRTQESRRQEGRTQEGRQVNQEGCPQEGRQESRRQEGRRQEVITFGNWIVHFDLKRLCFLRELNLYTSSYFIFSKLS